MSICFHITDARMEVKPNHILPEMSYKPEDQWSFKRSTDTGPGIYCNAFIHVYSPRAGADNPLGQMLMSAESSLSLCRFVASFKMISLKSDFIHIFNDFIHIYSPGVRAYNPLGTNF